MKMTGIIRSHAAKDHPKSIYPTRIQFEIIHIFHYLICICHLLDTIFSFNPLPWYIYNAFKNRFLRVFSVNTINII